MFRPVSDWRQIYATGGNDRACRMNANGGDAQVLIDSRITAATDFVNRHIYFAHIGAGVIWRSNLV